MLAPLVKKPFTIHILVNGSKPELYIEPEQLNMKPFFKARLFSISFLLFIYCKKGKGPCGKVGFGLFFFTF